MADFSAGAIAPTAASEELSSSDESKIETRKPQQRKSFAAMLSNGIESTSSMLKSSISYSIDTTTNVTLMAAGTVMNTVDSAIDYVSPTDPIVRLRPSWNIAFGMAIKTLRIAAHSVGRDVNSIRMLTDHGIPHLLLPSEVTSHKSTVPKGEWTYLKSINLKESGDLSKSPIVLYFHGGAFCCCGSNTHRGLIYRLVRASGAIVFAVDYRRPPEFPFPTPINDCIAAYKYLLSQVDSSRILFAGDSAGGSLVATVAIEAKRLGLPSPAAGIMLSPWVDLSDVGITDSWTRNKAFDYLPQDLAEYFARQYMGSVLDDAIVSPIYSGNLHDLPPLLIEVGECEVLHDQIVAFAEKCKAHGVEISLNSREDMVHVFCLFAFSGLAQCESAFESIAMFVRVKTREALSVDFPLPDCISLDENDETVSSTS